MSTSLMVNYHFAEELFVLNHTIFASKLKEIDELT